jgi:2,4-dienoyl-CoA reductase-like NADH-dependent reductase (Old Yellow Enzyme family)
MCAVLAPSEVPFSDTFPKTKALDEAGLKRIEEAFVAAIERCKQAGCECISGCLSS